MLHALASAGAQSSSIWNNSNLVIKNPITTTIVSATEIQSTVETFKSEDFCPDHFAFECLRSSCCASYHQRFLMLLFTLAIFLLALIVIAVWLAIEYRPSKIKRKPIKEEILETRELSDVQILSNEETKYLRRMSELNPNIRRECI